MKIEKYMEKRICLTKTNKNFILLFAFYFVVLLVVGGLFYFQRYREIEKDIIPAIKTSEVLIKNIGKPKIIFRISNMHGRENKAEGEVTYYIRTNKNKSYNVKVVFIIENKTRIMFYKINNKIYYETS